MRTSPAPGITKYRHYYKVFNIESIANELAATFCSRLIAGICLYSRERDNKKCWSTLLLNSHTGRFSPPPPRSIFPALKNRAE